MISRSNVFLGILLYAVTASPAHAQSAGASRAESAIRAREIVRAGLEAIAADEALDRLKTLYLRGNGIRYWKGQGRNPATPEAASPREIEWLLDFEKEMVWSASGTFQGDSDYFCFRRAYARDFAFTMECETHVLMSTDPASMERTRQILLRRFPLPRGRLLTALEQDSTLRYVESRDYLGAPHDLVAFERDGTPWMIYFERETGLPKRAEITEPTNMLLGVASYSETYENYRRLNGIAFPLTYVQNLPRGMTIGSVIRDSIEYVEIALNEGIDEGVFTLPDDTVTRRPDREVTISEVADGVLFIENARPNYNQLLVVFDGYGLVVDAPENRGVSERVIAAIKERLPQLELRYLLTSHFHFDHIGGFPSYVDEGATVVTTPGNAGFVVDVLDRSRAAAEEGALDAGREWPLELVEGKWVLDDGGQRLEVYEIGPNPHVDEMLVLYLPRHKILYVADVFSTDWGRVRPAIPETYAFADRLKALGLEVETMLPSHGPPASIADFERSLVQGGGR